ncbi:inositol monophosphatase family protein [Salinisphaera orenii]|uniref:inositol monophosphatase family protein n=1 Tax=Salinisphaera orenii TaxID=856731 RepID=UPI000DBE97BA
MSDWQPYLKPAIEAARAAEDVIRHYYQGGFEVTRKADSSPVTEADVECERVIKQVLGRAFPDHGFYGEELGHESSDADLVWLIDPIDGTKSFVRGYPFFSTQIALAWRGEPVVGVSNAPMFGDGELATAARGVGAWLNDAPIATSTVESLGDASLSIGNAASLATSPAWSDVGQLIAAVDRIRGYGDFYHYHLLASGRIDAVIESDLNILDIAALSVIVTEAGGRMTDLDGSPVGLNTRSICADNGQLRDAITPYLARWSQ